jgi:hypothetical protein
MSDTPTNHFSKKCGILADLWLNYKTDSNFEDFVEYNDIGLPLAYAFAEDLAKPTEIGTKYVVETYALLIEALEIEDDPTFETLDDLLSMSDLGEQYQ